MTCKNIVANKLVKLSEEKNIDDLSMYINKLDDEMVDELLSIICPPESVSNNNNRAGQIHPYNITSRGILKNKLTYDGTEKTAEDCRNILSQTYLEKIHGPCGTLQGGLDFVGGVLTAVQHITNQTSLWCMHNGDFKEVSGLQGDKHTRTYMKLNPESKDTFTYNLYKNHPDAKTDSKGNIYLPTDCVHSQAYLNYPGFEEEATAMLRHAMSDILPAEDLERLHVKITGTATLNNGDDKPYTNYRGKSALGVSRFARFPHRFNVADTDGQAATQENLIIEAVEFYYKEENSQKITPIFISTQHHDDASKGEEPHVDFGDDKSVNLLEGNAKEINYSENERTLITGILNSDPEDVVQSEEPTKVNEPAQGKIDSHEINKEKHKTNLRKFMEEIGRKIKYKEIDVSLASLDAFNALFIESSPEALWFDRVIEVLKKRYGMDGGDHAGLFKRLGDDANCEVKIDDIDLKSYASSLYVMNEKFNDAKKNIINFFESNIIESNQGDDSDKSKLTAPEILARPSTGWRVAGRERVLPSGVIGAAAMPVVVGNVATTSTASISSVAAAVGATVSMASSFVSGALLMAQGALMGHNMFHRLRRLGKAKAANKGRLESLRGLRESISGTGTLNNKKKTFFKDKILKKVDQDSVGDKKYDFNANCNKISELIEQFLRPCQSSDEAGNSDKKTEIERLLERHNQVEAGNSGKITEIKRLLARLKEVEANINQYVNWVRSGGEVNDKAVCLDRIKDFVFNLKMLDSMAEYVKGKLGLIVGDQEAEKEKKTVEEKQKAVKNLLEVFNKEILSNSLFKFEINLNDKLKTLDTERRDIKKAKNDARVNLATGAGYFATGTLLGAAFAVPILAPIATAVLGTVFGINLANSRYDQKRAQASQLDVHGFHREPWAPKVVGFHRELLARRAEQVEMNRKKNFGMGPKTMGRGVGLGSLIGLTTIGVVGLTVLSHGAAAIPLALGAGAAVLSTFLSASTYNLFNRHARRGATFGSRTDSSVHLSGVTDTTGRKKFYWGASKQSAQVQEKKQMILEDIDRKRIKDYVDNKTAKKQNVYSMRKGRKSSVLKLKGIAVKTDARHPFTYIMEKFINPNYSKMKQAEAIHKAFEKNWEVSADHATHALRLYAEHEINFLRNKAHDLMDKYRHVQAVIGAVVPKERSAETNDVPLTTEVNITQEHQEPPVTSMSNNGGKEGVHDLLVEEATELKALFNETIGQMKGVKSFIMKLEKFEQGYDAYRGEKDKFHKPSADEKSKYEAKGEEFKALISDFTHHMGLTGYLYGRTQIRALAKGNKQNLEVEVAESGRLNPSRLFGGSHINRIVTHRDSELSANLKENMNKEAYRNFANLLVFAIPGLMQYEIEKVFQTELQGRKPSGGEIKEAKEAKEAKMTKAPENPATVTPYGSLVA